MSLLETRHEINLDQNLSLDLAQMRPLGFLKRIQEYEKALVAKVTNLGGWIDNNHCLVCGDDRRAYMWKAYGIALLRCSVCNHHYFEKMPRNLGDVYEGAAYLEKSKVSYLANVDYRIRRFATERLNLISKFLPFVRNQKLLDIGCGTGWFVAAAKAAGYEVSGFEFSQELAKFTSENVGITVHHTDLEHIDGKFDVITLFDVIEHVPEPRRTFETVKSLLTKNGIVLVFCPNFNSVAIQAAKFESNLVLPTSHLSYLCELSKLQLLWYATAGIDVGDIMSWQEFHGMPKDLIQWQKLSDQLQPAFDQLLVGNHMRFVAKV
jgi:2-polyprenyl-3-methyl-5-hydroxy-6-metoxy-1,4-benzoquinol methylase